MARCATWPSRRGSRSALGVPKGIVQGNGDLVRLAPNGPKKIGEERAGRLILDGDVILPADGSTMNERRRIASMASIAVAVALDDKGRLAGEPASAAGHSGRGGRDEFIEEACDAAAERARAARTKTSCARRSASACAAARPNGPARSRWSTS